MENYQNWTLFKLEKQRYPSHFLSHKVEGYWNASFIGSLLKILFKKVWEGKEINPTLIFIISGAYPVIFFDLQRYPVNLCPIYKGTLKPFPIYNGTLKPLSDLHSNILHLHFIETQSIIWIYNLEDIAWKVLISKSSAQTHFYWIAFLVSKLTYLILQDENYQAGGGHVQYWNYTDQITSCSQNCTAQVTNCSYRTIQLR